jgi:hypothetical protein
MATLARQTTRAAPARGSTEDRTWGLPNWLVIPLGAVVIAVPAFLLVCFVDEEPPPHQPLVPIPPPEVMEVNPSPVVRSTPPPRPRLSLAEEREKAITRFRRDDEFAARFFMLNEKPFPGTGSYAVVFTKVVDPPMQQRLEERGLKFGEIFGPRSYEVFVSSSEVYAALNPGDVECLAPMTLNKPSEPKQPAKPGSWRAADATTPAAP